MMAVYDDMNEKTKENIQKSFVQLLKEKSFIKVSVQDIAKVSGINRGTFYLHYFDKYDLLDQMEENLLSGLEVHLERLQPDRLMLEAEKGNISMHAVEVFRYIQLNAETFKVFLGGNNRVGFHKRLKQFFVEHFLEKMISNELFFNSTTVPQDYLSSFATSAFLGLIEQWLDNDLAETPKQMAEMYIQIIFFIKNL